MKKIWIIIGIVLLALTIGALIFYNEFIKPEEERVFYTDAPGDVTGKSYIDGEVFIIDKDDPFFNR